MKRDYKNAVLSFFVLCIGTLYAQVSPKIEIQDIIYQVHEGNALVVPPDGYKKRLKLYSGKVYIPDSIYLNKEVYYVTDITDAFRGCKYLKEVRLPRKLKFIISEAFSSCISLQDIELPNEISHIYERAFRSCKSLRSIKLPDGLQRIGSSAFEGCRSLRSIEIPQHVVTIEDGAFEGCTRLRCVILPQSVDSIGYFAFGGCKGLKEIYVYSPKPPVLTGDINSLPVFEGVKNDIPVHIPKGSKHLFQTAQEWSLFTNYIDDL